MRMVVLVLPAKAVLAPAAPAVVTVRTPANEVGIPFWCNWGYDSDERCYPGPAP